MVFILYTLGWYENEISVPQPYLHSVAFLSSDSSWKELSGLPRSGDTSPAVASLSLH